MRASLDASWQRGIGEIPESVREERGAGIVHGLRDPADSSTRPSGEAACVSRRNRTYLFVSALEPLAAAEAAWSAPTPIDLCVIGPSRAAHDAARFACAGHAVQIIEEPLLATRFPDESGIDATARHAGALRALYALDTRSTLVVLDAVAPFERSPLLVDEAWLVHTAEFIERHLPLP
jgi:hypothetical protein